MTDTPDTTPAKKKLTLEQQIAKAEERIKTLKALQEKKEAARISALIGKDSKQDTRRKILIGAMNLAKLDHKESGNRARAALIRDLDRYLSRPDDRALFADLLDGYQRPSGPAPTDTDEQEEAVGKEDGEVGEVVGQKNWG